MKKTVVFALAAALISTAPLAAFAQQTPNPDVVRFVCRDAGLGKHSNVAKRLKNSIKAAAATAGIGNAQIRVTQIQDINRPSIEVPRASLNAGNIPVQVVPSPLSFSFGSATISIETPEDQSCDVEREFTILLKPSNGAGVTSTVRVSSPGKYKRVK